LGKLEQEQIIAVSDAQPTPEKNPFLCKSAICDWFVFSVVIIAITLYLLKAKVYRYFAIEFY